MTDVLVAVIGGIAVLLGLTSRLLRNWPVTEPLVALVAGIVIGPEILGLVELDPAHHRPVIEAIALPVLAISVMSAALRHATAECLAVAGRVVVLVLLALPLMGAATALTGAVVLGVPAATAALLGATLAPTDPVLASNAVSGDAAQAELPTRVRTLVSLESASNDGLAAAIVAVCVAATLGQNLVTETASGAASIVASVSLGGAAGWGIGRLLVISERRHDIEHTAFLALTLALVALVLGTVEAIGGIGIVAVFAAGIAYGHTIPRQDREDEWEVDEAVHQYLVLPAFTLFGVILPWTDWAALGWRGPVLAVAVLALRRLPVIAALHRPLRTTTAETAFIGWTGPVGIASLYLLAHAVDRAVVDERVWTAGTLVITSSIVVHGTTAAASRQLLAGRVEEPGQIRN